MPWHTCGIPFAYLYPPFWGRFWVWKKVWIWYFFAYTFRHLVAYQIHIRNIPFFWPHLRYVFGMLLGMFLVYVPYLSAYPLHTLYLPFEVCFWYGKGMDLVFFCMYFWSPGCIPNTCQKHTLLVLLLWPQMVRFWYVIIGMLLLCVPYLNHTSPGYVLGMHNYHTWNDFLAWRVILICRLNSTMR